MPFHIHQCSISICIEIKMFDLYKNSNLANSYFCASDNSDWIHNQFEINAFHSLFKCFNWSEILLLFTSSSSLHFLPFLQIFPSNPPMCLLSLKFISPFSLIIIGTFVCVYVCACMIFIKTNIYNLLWLHSTWFMKLS